MQAATGEADRTNNCPASVKVRVEEPLRSPDLEVG